MTTETIKSVLTARAQRDISNAVCNALKANESTGSLVTQVCNSAREHLKGKPMNDADMAAVIKHVAADRGWKGDAVKVRSSEVRTVLKAYVQLPDAVKYAQSTGTCNYAFAIKVARFIVKGKAPEAAVKAARKPTQKDAVPIEGRIASLLRKLFKEKRSSRTAASAAWDALNLKGDIAK